MTTTMPREAPAPAPAPSAWDEARLRLHALNRGWSNFSMLRRRDYDGAVCSMKNAGTHWVKYMLGLLLAELYELPPPEHLGSKEIIGHPRTPPVYRQIPQIVSSHSAPHHLLHYRWIARQLRLPRYVVVVRDMRHILVSYYEKWHGDDGTSFSDYLRGRSSTRRFSGDLWEFVRYLNAWAPIVLGQPERATVLRYEDLRADPAGELARIARHLGIADVTPELAQRIVARASKQEMAKRLDPSEDRFEQVISFGERHAFDWFSEADRRYFTSAVERNLVYDYGYDFTRWD